MKNKSLIVITAVASGVLAFMMVKKSVSTLSKHLKLNPNPDPHRITGYRFAG